MNVETPRLASVGIIRDHWLANIDRYLVSGRGFLVESGAIELDANWWPQSSAWLPRTAAAEPKSWDLIVLDQLSKPYLLQNGKALLRAATLAVKRRRPILVHIPGTLAELKRAAHSASKFLGEPWEIDPGAMVAPEELLYLISTRCEDANVAPVNAAQYLTPIERRMRQILETNNVDFKMQVPIGPFFADFLVEGRLVVECDGARWHEASVDRRRDEQIAALGYRTLRVTGRAIVGDAPGCLRRITTALNSQPAMRSKALQAPTPAQAAAIAHSDGPVIVVAPAGSGKTRVVSERVFQLVHQGADPTRICAISFTNAAVDEMKERLAEIEGIQCRTIHALGREICEKAFGKRQLCEDGKPGVPTPWALLRSVLHDDEYRSISKSGLKWAELIRIFRQSMSIPDLAGVPIRGGNDLEKSTRFMEIHAAYEARLREKHLCDFESMVLDAVRALSADPEYRMEWSSKVDFYLVDEVQDLPDSKLALLRLLCAPARNVMLVGDDDQVIYGFAGATPRSFQALSEAWCDITPIPLDCNFRCPHEIVVRSGWLVSRNEVRIAKNIIPQRTLDSDSRMTVKNTKEYEKHGVEFVVGQLAAGVPPSQIALLFRTRLMAAPVERLLQLHGIPYRPLAGTSVLNDPTANWMLSWLLVVAGLGEHTDYQSTLHRPSRYLSAKTIDHIVSAGNRSAIEERLLQGIENPEGWPRRSEAQEDSMISDGLREFWATLCGARAMGTDPSRILKHLGLANLATQKASDEVMTSSGTPTSAAAEVFNRLASHFNSVGEMHAWLTGADEDPHTLAATLIPAEKVSEQDERLVLSTIHMAKGLQFNSVAVLGPMDGMPDKRAKTPETREEERRIAYVAVTRAQNHLLFCCSSRYAEELSASSEGLDWPTYYLEKTGTPAATKPTQSSKVAPPNQETRLLSDLGRKLRSLWS